MFKRQTLFVLGAGSSAEVGLPVGTKLAQTIGAKMDIRFEFGMRPVGNGDFDLFTHVTSQWRQDADSFQRAAWLIRDGIRLAQSIDDFLDLHRTNFHANLYGKAAIVRAVLEAERGSKLYFGGSSGIDNFAPDRFADTWFVKFMHMLGRGVSKENVRQIFDQVSFIVFNYDRCVEYFLRNALQQLYGLPEQEALEIMADLNIIHPYGAVGELNTVPFGTTRASYVTLADRIKTYTEQIAAGQVITQLEAEIHRADCIVFLGFAYHNQNMLMLKPPIPMPHKFVFGTAFKMSDADVQVVTHQLSAFFTPTMAPATRANKIRLENKLTSADLFDNYARSLSGGD
jgi:hypothetical protein